MEALLDFSKKIDVDLLDRIVATSNNPMDAQVRGLVIFATAARPKRARCRV